MDKYEGIIIEWIEYGGVLNYDDGLYIMDDGEFQDWCKNWGKDSSDPEVAKWLCRMALENAGFTPGRIEDIMNW